MKVFDFVQGIKPRRNKFDLSYENKLTLNMGNLVPMFTHEVLPGDSWRVNSQIFLRFLAMIAPVMHRVDVWTHYFFVPNRLIWSEWEDFITGGPDGTSAPIPPYFDVGKVGIGVSQYIGASSLADYLGLGVLNQAIDNPGASKVQVSALPFRAYQLIYDSYYRDQNYINSVLFDGWKDSGNTYSTAEQKDFMTLRKRAWEHDFFTSILPDTQKGNDVFVPFGGDITVNYRDVAHVQVAGIDGINVGASLKAGTGGTTDEPIQVSTVGGDKDVKIDNIESLEVDDVVSVNSLRQSISLQGFLEAMMRFGSRYVEYLRGIFGTNPRDSRLQRPEYLGGGIQQVVISEVLQTSQSGTTAQGNMAGHGISVGRTNGFNRSFDEHGFVIGIMSVVPKTQYNSNMDKMWMRSTRLDYLQPHLVHLGERPVIQAELQLRFQSVSGFAPFEPAGVTQTDNVAVLGYQSQYAEYKYISGQTHGQFNDTLTFWTLGRLFDSSAATPINQEFIECTPRNDIFAVESDDDHLVCQIYHEVSALRPLPLFSTPSLLFPAHG